MAATASDDELRALVAKALEPPPSEEEAESRLKTWDPVELLVPEWRYLQDDPFGDHHEDKASGLTLSRRERDAALRPEITRVLAVERLRKVNALVGFTRIDAPDRVEDIAGRLVPLTRNRWPQWTVATEDRGEGIFLQLNENAVARWESRVTAAAYGRRTGKRTGATSTAVSRRPGRMSTPMPGCARRGTGWCTPSPTC